MPGTASPSPRVFWAPPKENGKLLEETIVLSTREKMLMESFMFVVLLLSIANVGGWGNSQYRAGSGDLEVTGDWASALYAATIDMTFWSGDKTPMPTNQNNTEMPKVDFF